MSFLLCKNIIELKIVQKDQMLQSYPATVETLDYDDAVESEKVTWNTSKG